MSASIIQKSADAFTDAGMTKLYLDAAINKGTLFLFDFLRGDSNPNPDGVLAAGATFKNLVDGGADAVYIGGSASSAQAVVANAAGKAGITSTGTTGNTGATPQIDLGSPQPTADKPFIVNLWVKGAGMGFTAGFLMGDTVSANGATGTTQWAWALYQAAANSPQYGQRAVGATLVGPSAVPASTAVRHLALSWVGGTLTTYINGVVFGSAAGLASPLGATGKAPFLNFGQPGTFYRASMERLDLSGRSALAAAQAEYALNNGRFA